MAESEREPQPPASQTCTPSLPRHHGPPAGRGEKAQGPGGTRSCPRAGPHPSPLQVTEATWPPGPVLGEQACTAGHRTRGPGRPASPLAPPHKAQGSAAPEALAWRGGRGRALTRQPGPRGLLEEEGAASSQKPGALKPVGSRPGLLARLWDRSRAPGPRANLAPVGAPLSWGQGSWRPALGPRLLGPSAENTGQASCWPPFPAPESAHPRRLKAGRNPIPEAWAGPGHSLWTTGERFIGENRLLGDYSQPDSRRPVGSPPKHTQIKYNKYNGPPDGYRGSWSVAPGWGPERRGAVQGRSTGVRRFLLGGTVAGRAGQAGCGGAPPAWVARSRQEPRRPAPAALCPPLLGEGREHAQVREVLDVIVAGPLGRVSGHGQHVLREGRREGRGRSAHPPGHLRVPGAQPAAPPHAHLPWGSPGVSGGPQMSTPGSRYSLGGRGHPSR